MDNPPKPGKQKKSPRSLPEAIPVASQGTPQHASRPAVKAPRRRWNPRTLLLLAGTAAAALIIPTAHRLLPDVSTRAEYIVSPAQITLSPPPHWIPADILQQTIDTAAKSGPLSLLDDSLTERIAAAFHTHPLGRSRSPRAKVVANPSPRGPCLATARGDGCLYRWILSD